MNEFQLVLLSTEDSNPQTGFVTNILTKPLILDGEWYVCLESIIMSQIKDEKIIPILVTIDCTINHNNGDVLAFFMYDGFEPQYEIIWQRVATDFIESITIRVQDLNGDDLDLADNKIAVLLSFKKLYKE